jgi:hypothetical protein
MKLNVRDSITVNLNGSARDRRKQFRALARKYPGATITKQAGDSHYTRKNLNGTYVTVEDADSPQTVVLIRPRQVCSVTTRVNEHNVLAYHFYTDLEETNEIGNMYITSACITHRYEVFRIEGSISKASKRVNSVEEATAWLNSTLRRSQNDWPL